MHHTWKFKCNFDFLASTFRCTPSVNNFNKNSLEHLHKENSNQETDSFCADKLQNSSKQSQKRPSCFSSDPFFENNAQSLDNLLEVCDDSFENAAISESFLERSTAPTPAQVSSQPSL